MSKLSADAAEALRICQVLDVWGADKVSGMALIGNSRDVIHYAAFSGREPEINPDRPAWVITFKGTLPETMLEEDWIDPTCVVIDHDGGMFGTGPIVKRKSGITVPPPPGAYKPDRALPPLVP